MNSSLSFSLYDSCQFHLLDYSLSESRHYSKIRAAHLFLAQSPHWASTGGIIYSHASHSIATDAGKKASQIFYNVAAQYDNVCRILTVFLLSYSYFTGTVTEILANASLNMTKKSLISLVVIAPRAQIRNVPNCCILPGYMVNPRA